LEGEAHPGNVHAEAGVVAVVSMASRWAPVMDGEIVELCHAWIKQEQGEIWAMAASFASQRESRGDSEVDSNLHPWR
jgi:hypothetical protein